MANRTLLWLFVLCHVVLGLTLALMPGKSGPTPLSLVFVALVLCQSSLIAAWAALRPSNVIFRLVLLVVGSLGLSFTLSLGIGEPGLWTFVVGTGTSLVVAAVLFGWRCLTGAALIRPHDDNVASREAIQFGIRHLMSLTVVVAVVLAVARWVVPLLQPSLGGPAFEVGCVLVGAILTGIVCAWASLGNRGVIWRVPLALGAAFILGVIEEAVVNHRDYVFAIITWTQAGWTILSLAALRSIGFRLVKRERS